jgi:DNA-directed RNA polymerase specialized sigma24 family protein
MDSQQQQLNDGFATTRWSVVLAAKDRLNSDSRRALEELAQIYWFPLYAHVRGSGCDPDEAADFTQEFFARLLEKNFLATVDPSKGKFRSFLRVSLNHFLSNEFDKARVQKRGGHISIISLDIIAAESRYQNEPGDEMTAERLFERRWAHTLLDHAICRLREYYAQKNKADFFDAIKKWLTSDKLSDISLADIAGKWSMSTSAVKDAVYQLRHRYCEYLKDEVAQTLTDPTQVDEEINYLRQCL